jgi:hypothetical protein
MTQSSDPESRVEEDAEILGRQIPIQSSIDLGIVTVL